VAPPSVHSSGVRYTWVEGRDPGSRAIAPLPDWVLQLAVDQPSRRGHSVAHWRQLVSDGVPEGERNNTIASLTGYLLRNGVDPAVAIWNCSFAVIAFAAGPRCPTTRWWPWSRASRASTSVTRRHAEVPDSGSRAARCRRLSAFSPGTRGLQGTAGWPARLPPDARATACGSRPLSLALRPVAGRWRAPLGKVRATDATPWWK
jgi:primase-like protein